MPGRGLTTVDLSAENRPAADLAAIGRHVAATVRYGRADRIAVAYRPTRLPSGTVIRSVSRDSTGGTRY